MLSLLKRDTSQKNLWKLFERHGGISHDQFRDIIRRSAKKQRSPIEGFFDSGILPAEKIAEIFSEYFQLPVVNLRNTVIARPVLNLLPKEVAEQQSLIIFKKIKNIIHVATLTPDNHHLLSFIQKHTGLEPQFFLTTPADIQSALRRYESDLSSEFAKIIDDSIQETLSIHDTAEKMAQYVPIIKMVNTIIDEALAKGASDIHIEPRDGKIAIRFRIDGLLHNVVELPKEIHPPFITRIKILANCKIDEHRLPQDGRCMHTYANRQVAIRVAILPTLHGPKAVLRLLDASEKEFNLKKLGLDTRDLQVLRREIQKPYGMILVTGPTGSGKTTTLYTILRMLNRENVNICTIEDPIEYGLEGINQSQINVSGGLTFATGLRSLLRQDPDIIMVGEIRDSETATIAMNAAMTGHLVLSTIHTNSAFLAPKRLIEMGVEPFLVGSVLNVIIGQRLVRVLCKRCQVRVRSTQDAIAAYEQRLGVSAAFNRLKSLQLLPEETTLDTLRLMRGRGCSACNQTGYQGRIGIYEMMPLNEHANDLILHDASAEAIRKYAMSQGTLTMLEDGLRKVFSGITTFEELMRIVKE